MSKPRNSSSHPLTRIFRSILSFFLAVILLLFFIFLASQRILRRSLDNCARLQQEIAQYDWDQDTAFAIAQAESGCDPHALGDRSLTFKGCFLDLSTDLDDVENFGRFSKAPCVEAPEREYGYSIGAFQVRILPGRTECDTFDLATNVKCAYRVYQEKNFSFTPWSVFNDQTYLEFMPSTQP